MFVNQGIIVDYAIWSIDRFSLDIGIQKTKGTSYLYIPVRIGKNMFPRLRYNKK